MLFSQLENIWKGIDYPFFRSSDGDSLYFNKLKNINIVGIENIRKGDVVALIGDFERCNFSSINLRH